MDKNKLFLEQVNKSEEFKEHSKDIYAFRSDKDFVDLQKYMWDLYYLVPVKDDQIYVQKDDEESIIFVFTDMDDFNKWNQNKNYNYSILDYDELHSLLNSTNASALFNFWNEEEDEFRFTANDLKNLYKIRILSNATNAEYIIGTPKVLPKELMNKLLEEFTQNMPIGVDNCYLSQCSVIEGENVSTYYIFVLDCPSKIYLYLEEICYSFSKKTETKFPVMFVHSSSDLGQMILQSKIKPFFTKQENK